MNRSLYIFNPDHDLALANGDANFNPPVSARTFASDLAALPLWYASPDSFVWARLGDSGWLTRIQYSFPQLSDIYVGSNPNNIPVVPSYKNFAKNTKPSKNIDINSNTDNKAQKNMSESNMSYVSQEMVKSIDINKKFAVVLGSFIKYENAQNAKKRLTDKGYHVDVVHFDDPNV
ncbi:MAG: hypothetical protein Q8909_12760, partial [Bacteroidota bacterium]|nr:hypothetical protein [Bacteroidota bacterium]